jgi:alpha-1,3-rhamnosyltransferase
VSTRDQPLVTVVIPAYNHEACVARALHSVLAQSYPNIELIVVDDGSTDRTWEVIQHVHSTSGHPFQLYSHSNRGVSATLNSAIRRSTGTFIAPLASDDWYVVDKIERQVNLFLALASTVGVVHSSSYNDFGDGHVVATHGQFRPAVGACLRELLACEVGVVAPTCMFRRAVYESVGGFDESMVAEDVDFYVGVAARGYHFAYDPAPLVYKTVTGSNLGAQIGRWADVHHRTLRKYADRFSEAEYTALSNALHAHLGRIGAGAGNLGLSLTAYAALARASRSMRPYLHFGREAARYLLLSTLPASLRHRLRRLRATRSR